MCVLLDVQSRCALETDVAATPYMRVSWRDRALDQGMFIMLSRKLLAQCPARVRLAAAGPVVGEV
eukprot:8734418-Pyramimonas_sp.AAC.1